MNKIMKKYIEKVGSEPGDLVKEAKERHWFDKLFGIHPYIGIEGTFKNDFPVMYSDPGLPSYSKILLYGLDFDFLMFECLVIACMDRCNYLPNAIQSGMAFGVLIAFIFDVMLIWIRVRTGRRNLATHTLSDERFMIG